MHKAQIGIHAFKLAVLFFQFLHPPKLRHLQACILLSPFVKGNSTDAKWNAEPNSPDVRLFVEGNNVTLEFYLNYFVYERFREGDKARLTFTNCHKYSFNTMNDEGYYYGQYRYDVSALPLRSKGEDKSLSLFLLPFVVGQLTANTKGL